MIIMNIFKNMIKILHKNNKNKSKDLNKINQINKIMKIFLKLKSQ